MAFDSEVRKRIQIALALAIFIAAARTTYVLYQRHADATRTKPAPPPLNPDAYITPKKLYPYDLKSAKEGLAQQPVWVKVGNWYPYFEYNAATRRADLEHIAGRLQPLQKLQIQDVLAQAAPSGPGKQVLAVFELEGKKYAAQIGNVEGSDYKFHSDAMFFIEDPHDLYKHWPPEVWDAISNHQIKPGMSELQANFAVGAGTMDPQGDPTWKTMHYPNNGKPLTVTYHNDKATEVKEDKTS